MKEFVKLMELITHPEPVLTSRVIAGHEANAAIGGHANAVEEGIAEGVKMGFPGLRRTIARQLNFEDRRTLSVNGDQDGSADGKNLITEIKHHFLLCRLK